MDSHRDSKEISVAVGSKLEVDNLMTNKMPENFQEKSDIESGSPPNETTLDQDPSVVDFDGPDDPSNPLNWPSSKKFIVISIVSFITFLSPVASTMITPSTSSVMEEFKSNNVTTMSFITSIYLLGYAFGPLVIAPLSEMYGRVPLYNVCNLLFFIFNIACAVAPNIGSLLFFRLMTGIAGSCPVTIGAGSIADMVSHDQRGRAMSGWILGPLLGPVIGPVAGGYLTHAKGWRWSFWVLSIASGFASLITLISMRESCVYVILKRKTEHLRKETGNQELRSTLDTDHSSKELFVFSITRPLKLLFLSPIVFLLSLYTSTIYSYLYLCFTTFPRVFEEQYAFSQQSSGLEYLGIGIGCLLGLFLAGSISDRVPKYLTKRNGGEPQPEYRLPTMIIGGFCVPIGLFWYGWTAQAKVHWILPIIGTGFLGGGMVIAYLASSMYLVDTYTVHAASAIAAGTVFRSLLGALLPLAGGKMYDSLGIGWGTSLLAFISLGMLPLPFIFFKYGHRIRETKFFQYHL